MTGDGLSNLSEYFLGTYPYHTDSDDDGLDDGEEINVYGTDPLKEDTDKDGLEDGDEILFGTDPLLPDTDGNGIPDGEEHREQSLHYTPEDNAITDVCVTMDATGNIADTTHIEDIMNIDMLCSGVVGLVGDPFEITTSSDFTEAVITFTVDTAQLGETDFHNLMFLWYDEKSNNFAELETLHNEEAGTVSVHTTHFSRYMLVDRQEWFENWNKIEASYSEYYAGTRTTAICVDCSGSISSGDSFFWNEENGVYTCGRKQAVQSFINAMSDGDMASLILFSSYADEVCGLTWDKTRLLDASDMIFPTAEQTQTRRLLLP